MLKPLIYGDAGMNPHADVSTLTAGFFGDAVWRSACRRCVKSLLAPRTEKPSSQFLGLARASEPFDA